MKTFREIRDEVIAEIGRSEIMGNDKKITFGQIETMAAKEYAKQWVEEFASLVVEGTALGLPINNIIERTLEEIDEQ
jgi:hypothetical protein